MLIAAFFIITKRETTQMSIKRQKDTQNVVYAYNGILFGHKIEMKS